MGRIIAGDAQGSTVAAGFMWQIRVMASHARDRERIDRPRAARYAEATNDRGHCMSVMSIPLHRTHPAAAAAIVIAVVGAATILGAYYFQYGLHYEPCELCLKERVPYYAAVPLALVVALAAWLRVPRPIVIGGLVLLALLMLAGVGLGVYHAGVEWKFWPGPVECSGSISNFGSASGLLDKINGTRLVPCDVAAFRILGISLAGYNALISLALAAVALWGAAKAKA
jgi:disulfide bond formation protein DsbB